jgi:hypothetical protein
VRPVAFAVTAALGIADGSPGTRPRRGRNHIHPAISDGQPVDDRQKFPNTVPVVYSFAELLR